MKPTDNGPLLVRRLPRTNLVLIAFATSVHDAMEGNALVPTPSPTLVVFAAHIADFVAAEAAAMNKTKGAAKQRNAKKQKVVQDLRHIGDYVQEVMETLGSPADARALAASLGFGTQELGTRHKPVISARVGELPGMVYLDAKAVAPNATYYWQYSLDQKTWTNVPEMMQSSTSVIGLTSAQLYYFRFRTLTRKGMSDFSQIVSLLVR